MPNTTLGEATPTTPFGLPRQLLETLRVACFPTGVRSAQVAQGKPPFDTATSTTLSTSQDKLRTSSVQAQYKCPMTK
ncbi:MAG: hypothetical protein V7K88_23435 [Nostoc sp.]|uniref:hypothetical protein n=1 Tax=Nostoc sp. TaxID=1180 RepID=UPI002FF9F26F